MVENKRPIKCCECGATQDEEDFFVKVRGRWFCIGCDESNPLEQHPWEKPRNEKTLDQFA